MAGEGAAFELTLVDVQALAKFGIINDVDSMTEYLRSYQKGEYFFHQGTCLAKDLYQGGTQSISGYGMFTKPSQPPTDICQ